MNEIKITVVIPSFKANLETIERTIVSVLNQTYKPIEILLIDDNDENDFKDISKLIAEKYNFQLTVLYNNKNMGANFSRNHGIQKARGDFIAFLDSDDEWSDNYLEQVSTIITKEKALWVTTNYQVVHKDGILPPEFNPNEFISEDISKKELYKDYVGPTSTVVISRKVIMTAGMFDTSLPARQDYDMWLRVSKLVPIYYNYTPCVKIYRVGNDSISSSYKRNIEGTKLVLQKILSTENLTDDEKKRITALHYKQMALSCILCNAYKESRIYAKKSLQTKSDHNLFFWLLLSYCPAIFTALRHIRRRKLYSKKMPHFVQYK